MLIHDSQQQDDTRAAQLLVAPSCDVTLTNLLVLSLPSSYVAAPAPHQHPEHDLPTTTGEGDCIKCMPLGTVPCLVMCFPT
jgi:hypothetical protein